MPLNVFLLFRIRNTGFVNNYLFDDFVPATCIFFRVKYLGIVHNYRTGAVLFIIVDSNKTGEK